jgi:FMN-dependent oxidoreductase (nitrilotriacetate monooxygenase family)
MTAKPIHLNAFVADAVTHQSPASWRHAGDRGGDYKRLDHWIGLAKTLDQAGFDALFIADGIGISDVYGGGPEAALRRGIQVPMGDPNVLVSAMAAVTTNLGFGITASVSYEPPFNLARRYTTLDHLTNGRVGWNVVTGYMKSASTNLGLEQVPHDERYALADEFMEVCYKLWEYSWEEDAVVADVRTGVYADVDKIHPIDHKGTYFNVPGVFLCEPSPQRTPVIFQAGASSAGLAFAGKHAEAVFVSGPSTAVVRRNVDKLRAAAEAAGRSGSDLTIYVQMTPVVGETSREATAKFENYLDLASTEGALSLFGGWTGLDLAGVPGDQPLKYVETDAGRSALAVFTADDPNREWTTDQIARHLAVGGRGPVAVGAPDEVADELEKWIEETGADGFNLAYATTPGTFEEVAGLVIPELERRGRMAARSDGQTLREVVSGRGPRLQEPHVGASYRR